MHRLPAPTIPSWIAAELPFERYRVDVGGLAMHVMEHGEGMPVVMLHGNPTWGFLYRRVAARVRDAGVRVILPDLIGLGYSDRPAKPSDHTLAAHARWFGALLDTLDLRRFVFVGQDWGGPIGLRALADRSDRVAGMVILNTAIGPPRPGFRPTAFHRFANMPIVSDVAFRLLGFPQRALFAAQGDKRSLRGEVLRAYVEPLRHVRDNAAPLALARMVPDSAQHPSVADLRICQDFFTSARVPIEVVWGDRDPILGSVRRWIEKLRPDVPVTRTNAGHFLQEEVPDEIAAAVKRVVAAAA
jgi:haloalkane dehalogenase